MGAVTFHPGGLRQRILLVTNDFPPRPGGIQSYLQEMVSRLAGSHEVTVYAPRWKGCERYDAAAEYQVVRHPTSLMLPGPGVRQRMVDLIRAQHADVVWFGAAAPLALLSSAAKAAGAAVTAASTHGHEVGWSMLPVARSALRQIGESTDVITYVSRYTAAVSPLPSVRAQPSNTCRQVSIPIGFAPIRRHVKSCESATGSATGRPSYACPVSFRARDRTC